MYLGLTKTLQHTYTHTQLLTRLTALCQYTPTACIMVSNSTTASFDFMLAYGSADNVTANTNCLIKVQQFYTKHNNYIFGHFGYDIKNEIEKLTSANANYQGFNNTHFFVPEVLIKIKNEHITFLHNNITQVDGLIQQLFSTDSCINNIATTPCNLHNTTTKENYISTVNAIKNHIQRGDIYITNYCINYVSEHTIINPYQKFITLNNISNAPFATFYKHDTKYVLCASPERYIQRTNNKLTSMPIKGTRKRGATPTEDAAIAEELRNNAKEQNENVMIVDLVRNDLSRVAMQGTVRVDELFKVHTFNAVHQLISTILCEVAPTESLERIVNATFPMGSMTGAPKISAMQLMEHFENFKRGIYSGTIGYVKPNGNFDFNVVIRSIIYNAATQVVSLPVGSAITSKCNAIDEYEECLLKAKVLLDIMN